MNKKQFKTKVFKRIVESLKQDEDGVYIDASIDNAIDKKLKKIEDIDAEDQEISKKLSADYANLITNFSKLLNLKNLLIKKVLNHANTKFDREIAKKVEIALEDQYDLSLKEKDPITAPPAAGAGNSPNVG